LTGRYVLQNAHLFFIYVGSSMHFSNHTFYTKPQHEKLALILIGILGRYKSLGMAHPVQDLCYTPSISFLMAFPTGFQKIKETVN
jgi:hypothetical protein